MRYLILIPLLLTGCARGHRHQLLLAPGTEKIVSAFEADAAAQNVNLYIDDLTIIYVPELNPSEVGRCSLGEDETPVIRLSTGWWDYLDDSTKELVLFHELGHCLLHRIHRDGFITDQSETIPQSIMATNLIGEYYYNRHKAYYLYEFFHVTP